MAQAILYNPHPNQQKIHNSINDEEYKYYVICIGRQFGKTMMATNQMMYWALNNPRSKIAWVSPVYKQAKKVFADTYKAFIKRPEIYKNINKGDLIVEYRNGSTIQFFSSERYDNIRGYTFDYLICDEFAFMDSEAWTEVLRATVLVKGKKVILISTPRGKNHFYHLHQLDSVNPQYKSFSMSSYDNPMINRSEIDDAKLTLPEHIFKQEYMAEFLDGGSGLFLHINYSTHVDTSPKYYAGLDLGRADDYTVLTIFNQQGQMVFVDRWRQTTWSNIVAEVCKHINTYQAFTFVEVNSIGDAIFEQVQKGVMHRDRIYPFVTTSKSKQDIIEALIVANNNKEVQFLPVDWLRKEFEVFTYEYNPSSKSVKYSAPSGFHDDGVMATCIAYYSLKANKNSGIYNVR